MGTFTVMYNTYDTTTTVPSTLQGISLPAGKTYCSGMVKWEITKA